MTYSSTLLALISSIKQIRFSQFKNLWGPPRGMGISLLHSFSKAFPSFTARLQCSNPGVCRFSLLPPITWSLPLQSWVAGAYLKIILSWNFHPKPWDKKERAHNWFYHWQKESQTRETQHNIAKVTLILF